MPYYAVNVADLSTQQQKRGPMCPPMLMLRDILTKEVVECEGQRLDGGALLLQVEPERMEAILSILREGVGAIAPLHRNLFRIYRANKPDAKTWKRV